MNPREIRTDVVERGDSKARLDLESRVLSAALKQSFERGDVEGVSLAHRQLFLLLKSGHKPDLGNGDAKKRLSSENITIPSSDSDSSSEASAEPEDNQGGTVSDDGEEETDKSEKKGSELAGTVDETAGADAAEIEHPAAPATQEKEEHAAPSSSEPAAPEAASEAASEAAPEAAPPEGAAEPTAEEYNSSAETLPPTPMQELAPPTAQMLSQRRRTEEFVEPPPNPWLQIGPNEGFASQVTTPLAVYELLDVAQVSSFEEIHRNFLRKVRALLIQEAKITDRKERFQALRKLQFLWIAHDILTDPVTRTDCDLRAIGLRGILDEIIPQAPEDASQGGPSNRTPLRIGELLLCAGLLEPTELEIAADMHKAMPEMMFGAFLVKQEFIEEDDLNTVLLGQKLLRSGVITVVQFQTAMEMKRKEGKDLADSLVSLGYVSQREIYAATASTQFGVNPGPPPERIEIVSQTSDGKEAPVTSLELGNAAPSWKDQLDWSEPERVHLPSVEPMTPPPPPPQKTMGSVLIDGVTDFAESEPASGAGGKSSLRSLIAGIQAELTALDISTLTDEEEQEATETTETTDTTDAAAAAGAKTAEMGETTEEVASTTQDAVSETTGEILTGDYDGLDLTGESQVSSAEDSQHDREVGTESGDSFSDVTSPNLKARDDARVTFKESESIEPASDEPSMSDAEVLKATQSQKITDPDLPVAEVPRSSIKTSERPKLDIDFELESEKITKAREARATAALEPTDSAKSEESDAKDTDSSADAPATTFDTTARSERKPPEETFDAHPPPTDNSAAPSTTSGSPSQSQSRETQEATGKIRVDRPHVRTDDSEWQVFPKKDPEKGAADATDNFEPPHDEPERAITDDITTDERSAPPITTTSFPDPTLDAPPPHATLDEKASDEDSSSSDENSDPDSEHTISDTDAGKSGNRHKRKNI